MGPPVDKFGFCDRAGDVEFRGLLGILAKRPCSRPMLDLCDGDDTVREKSSTYETIMPVGMRKCTGAT